MIRRYDGKMPLKEQHRAMQVKKRFEISNRHARVYENSLMIFYDCKSGLFTYPEELRERFSAEIDHKTVWDVLKENKLCEEQTAEQIRQRILEAAGATTTKVHYEEYYFRNTSNGEKWYCLGFISSVPGTTVIITITDINEDIVAGQHFKQRAEYDELTVLLNRNVFCRKVDSLIKKNPEAVQNGQYAMVYFDVLRFKAINDMFGMAEGDRVLCYVADLIQGLIGKDDLACRIDSDRFTFFTNTCGDALETMIEKLFEGLSAYKLPFAIACNVGIYVTVENEVSAVAMMDRAILAQSKIKGSHTVRFHYYTEEMRNDLLSEQEISGIMEEALNNEQFLVYYQPQFNHSTGSLVGAEALVRWKHPERGLISPGLFIPIFERNGFITKLDLYVFEHV